jgi:hypothetical protein
MPVHQSRYFGRQPGGALKLLVGAERDIVGADLVVADLDEAVAGDGARGIANGVFSAHGFSPVQ